MSYFNEILAIRDAQERRRRYRCKLLYPHRRDALRPESLEYLKALTYAVVDRKTNTQSALMADIKGRDIQNSLSVFSLDDVKDKEVKMRMRLFSL